MGPFLAAILLHMVVLYFVDGLFQARPPHKNANVRFVSLNKAKSKPSKPKEELSKKTPKIEPKGQVVALAPSLEQIRPKKADFLSTFNQSVKRQTQSAYKNPHSKRVTRKPSAKRPQVRPSLPHEGKRSNQKVTKRAKSFSQQQKNGLRAENRALSREPQKKALRLIPTWQELSQEDGMPFSDYLKDVEIDAETRLNALQWRHATFFNRIKESVAREWNPGAQIRRFDPRGTLIGRQDRLTVVKVTIDKSGKVIGTQIGKTSGVDYLDEEALRAFRVSGPFVHPPTVLFANAREFSFEFGFVLSVGNGFGMGFGF